MRPFYQVPGLHDSVPKGFVALQLGVRPMLRVLEDPDAPPFTRSCVDAATSMRACGRLKTVAGSARLVSRLQVPGGSVFVAEFNPPICPEQIPDYLLSERSYAHAGTGFRAGCGPSFRLRGRERSRLSSAQPGRSGEGSSIDPSSHHIDASVLHAPSFGKEQLVRPIRKPFPSQPDIQLQPLRLIVKVLAPLPDLPS